MSNINDNEHKGTFVSHLTELRSRIVKSFIFLFIVFLICYFFSTELYAFLVKPYSNAILENNLDRRLIFTALHDAFLTYLKVAFFSAFSSQGLYFFHKFGNLLHQGFIKMKKKLYYHI